MYPTLSRLLILMSFSICLISSLLHGENALPASHHELLRYELSRIAEGETLQNISDADQGKKFLEALGGHEKWLGDLFDSGPIKHPERVLTFLHRVWVDDTSAQNHDINRSMATACALALGMNTRLKGDWMWERYVYFRDSWKDGMLNKCYGELPTWQRRYLARGPQYSSYSTAESMQYLRDRICLPRKSYTGACWQAPYRGFNCFGDSVQGPQYYAPFRGSFSCDPEMAIEVGGVCGALSNLGTAAAIANGIPATSMGEPGHCAYAVLIESDKWQPSYSLSWKRGMHTSLYRSTWPSLMMTQDCFSQPELVSSAGDLVRQSHFYEDQGNLLAADKAMRKATNVHPLHYGIWQEQAEFGIRNKRNASWWGAYHGDVLRLLAPSNEEPAWALLTTYVYKNTLGNATDNKKASVFVGYMKSFDDFGNSRWNIEGAWDWMLKQIKSPDVKKRFQRQVAGISITKPGIGAAVLAWSKQKCGDDADSWVTFQNWLVKLLAKEGEDANNVIRNLGKTAMPSAAKRGDLISYQAVGKLCSRLYKPSPTDGIVPFDGELLSDGGLINISGIGERYDSPERHWGVLNLHGGALHTNTATTPWVEVRLGNFGRLNGIVIQNRGGGNMWRAGGARVLVSTDQKQWKQVATLKGAKKFYRIDLSDSKPIAGYLRIERDGHCMHFARILAYGKRAN